MSLSGQAPLARNDSDSDYSLPCLRTASSSKIEITKEYKSGAKYEGQVEGTRKAGRGMFIWPNGARYDGEFVDNCRQGKGVQTWADGSIYDGEFEEDMRHGQGHHTWANGESYKGTFFRDRRHGKGEYTWPDKSIFTGSFYMDRKESYGKLVLANGNTFEGLYKADEREGPGVLTYPDRRQDVGMWHRQKLIRLCTSDPKAFNIKDYPELDYFPEEHEQYIDMNFLNNNNDIIRDIVSPQEQFNYPPVVDISHKVNEVFSDTLHFNSSAVDVKVFEMEFFKNCKSSSERVKSWNNTPSMVAMQRHIMRHKPFEKGVNFNVEKVIRGDRTGFGEKGPLEEQSEVLLKSATTGDTETLKILLNNDEVDADVADNQGHNALLAASINWHQDAINILLDNGANVNKLTDQGVSSLGACHVHYFPADSFKYNVAEKDLKRPTNTPQEAGYNVNEAVKTLIPTSPKRKVPVTQSKRKNVKEIEIKKIQKLRQEYSKGGKRLQEISEERGGTRNQDLNLQDESQLLEERDRTLGHLQINRVSKQNIDEILGYDDLQNNTRNSEFSDEDDWSETEVNDFESVKSVRNMRIEVSDDLIERCATQLSSNNLVTDRTRSATLKYGGTVRELAIDKNHILVMRAVIDLLLKRGADPNASAVPMPVLFFAIKAADVTAVHKLLVKGASTSARLSPNKGGLTALHIAVAIPGDEGVLITELLLHSLAHPDARAAEDDSYLNRSLEDEWSKDFIDDNSQKLLGGRTPLHIACARDDNYRNACRVVRLLLQHHANPNLLCNGHSPLALAIISGNDLAIDELLLFGADVCLPLTHGVGSALCVASNTDYETRRTPEGRIKLIDKLVQAGGDILTPIPIGPKRVTGTVVDYAHYIYNLIEWDEAEGDFVDRRIAHMPYHALTHAERETFNARRELLAHLGNILREKSVERERYRMQMEEAQGTSSRSPSPNFVYTGAGAKVAQGQEGHVTFGRSASKAESEIRKPLFRYCYECGRSIGVRLSPCTRCKEVFYCSKACKLKAWNARHKEECIRVQGRSRSPSPRGGGNRIDSPTPGTDPDAGKPNTVAGIMAGSAHRTKLPPIGRSGLVGRHSDDSQLSSDNESTDSATNFQRKRGQGSKKKKRTSGKSHKGSLRRSASWDDFDNAAPGRKGHWAEIGRGRDLERSKGRSREDRSGGKQSERPSKSGKSNRSNRTRSAGREKHGKDPEDQEFEEFIKVKYGKNKPVRTAATAVEDANEFEEFLKLKERVKKRGLVGLDLANNPLFGKPPKSGQRNPAVFLLKIPLNQRGLSQQPMRYKSGAVMDRAMQLALLRLQENAMKDTPQHNPWRMVDGKWVYFDNYSYV